MGFSESDAAAFPEEKEHCLADFLKNVSYRVTIFHNDHSESVLGLGKFVVNLCVSLIFGNEMLFYMSSTNVGRPLIAGAFADDLTSHSPAI